MLLHLGRINAYALAVIQTMRADEHERGCLKPGRTNDNSLAFQRWVSGARGAQVPPGTKEDGHHLPLDFFRPSGA